MIDPQQLYKRSQQVIPGATQLLSKRAERFLPEHWPTYYSKAEGITIWGVDGKKYIDTTIMSVGTCVLGYADPDVNQAVNEAVADGNISTLNAPEEIELAELLIELHPWSEMVRYSRTGGEAMAIAVRLVRAHTNKETIMFCGYHGWHDWYLSANLNKNKALDDFLLPGLEPKGVPQRLAGTMIPFEYNDIDNFVKLFNEHRRELAGVVMEPIRNHPPEAGYLEKIRQLCTDNKVPLVFDEITIGWRECDGGYHKLLGVNPDIAVFAKAMSNGYPMAAIIGKRAIMDQAQETFISSTYWTDKVGTVAALATIRKFKARNVARHLKTVGKLVQDGWNTLAKKHKLQIKVHGVYALSGFEFTYKNSAAIRTLFTQYMLEHNYLANTSFYISYAHKRNTIEKYLRRVDYVFSQLKQDIDNNAVEKKLKGPVSSNDFTRLN
ncbi:MAG: aminotransferase class III [Candidatus Pacebacteria bacterium CG10_big_fil_rev_8_21_14_0_10_56_10]|nr:MAG: aminotransferase class III [Candidatus Pacebacteria bacterium CG10_big_fil_rev_8_21_14_0_10_56_10]